MGLAHLEDVQWFAEQVSWLLDDLRESVSESAEPDCKRILMRAGQQLDVMRTELGYRLDPQ